MTYTVIIAPKADRQIGAINAWWRANRLAAPELFDEELHRAIARMKTFPETGASYARTAGVRYLLLPATRYRVYFRVDEGKARVNVLRVRSGRRGSQPSF